MHATLNMGTHHLNAEITVDGGLDGGTVLIRPISRGTGESIVSEFKLAMETRSERLSGVPSDVCEAVMRGAVDTRDAVVADIQMKIARLLKSP